MITDIFSRRYQGFELRDQYYQEDSKFLHQAANMIKDRLWLGYSAEKESETAEANLKAIHDALALELGTDYLSDRWWFRQTTWNGNTTTQSYKNNYATICKRFLELTPNDLKIADGFIKDRLSLIELAFQRRATLIEAENKNLPFAIAEAERQNMKPPPGRGIRLPGSRVDAVRANNKRINEQFAEIIEELNQRLRLAKYPLSFHNGLLQISDDEIVEQQVAQPFWALVSDSQWANVDEQIKEAIDRRDRGDRTAAFHAVCALESAIKIISDTKGWTRGTEKGAANYIDNLQSKQNGRFIETWEAEMLKDMFGDVRNPFAHGPGGGEMPHLRSGQTNWAIDTSMAWIKSLVRRL